MTEVSADVFKMMDVSRHKIVEMVRIDMPTLSKIMMTLTSYKLLGRFVMHHQFYNLMNHQFVVSS